MATNGVGKPAVSPLRGFLMIFPAPFPQLTLWATLCRASGTFTNTDLDHYRVAGCVFSAENAACREIFETFHFDYLGLNVELARDD